MATKKKTTVETDKPAKTVKAVKATAKTTAAKSAAPAKAVKEAKASKTAACNKALKEAAELAPLVQSAKDGTGENTSVEDAQKAAEFLMNNYEKNSEEKIIVDGIVIPTQAELLNMPESDYMNERQQAFFKHLLREREAQLRSNAGATAEHLRDNSSQLHYMQRHRNADHTAVQYIHHHGSQHRPQRFFGRSHRRIRIPAWSHPGRSVHRSGGKPGGGGSSGCL